MIRDYISYISNQIENLSQQEKIIRDSRENLLKDLPPTATYKLLDITDVAKAVDFRTVWQKQNYKKVDCLEALAELWKEGRTYYEAIFESPEVNLALLPPYSCVIRFTFTLAQPYISRDEQDFYIIDNPVRTDKIFGLPYVASTSWKGSLRAALWQSGYNEKHNLIRHLFGNEKESKDHDTLHAGRLHFFPTFFKLKSLEIINPQDRKSRAGTNPILFESVPIDTEGTFTLLYVPFDLVGEEEKTIREQCIKELQLVTKGLQAMFRTYGFGAKTRSGFGLAKETILGTLRLRILRDKQREKVQQAFAPPAALGARYLETSERLKPEYLTPEGTFRERSDTELKKMKRSDEQLYVKAKNWWEKVGKQLAEAANLPKPAEPTTPEPQPVAQPISWPEWSFRSFEQLSKFPEEMIKELTKEVQGE